MTTNGSRNVGYRQMRIVLSALCIVASVGCRSLSRTAASADAVQPAQDSRKSTLYLFPTDRLRLRIPVKTWRTMQREHVVMQKLDYSCGAASLATIFRYYFEDEVGETEVLRVIFLRLARSEDPVKELKDRIEKGFSMLDLLNAAKDLGYLGAVVRIPISKLAESKAPVIVRIEKLGYEHFVVFRGVWEDRVYLADPVRGNVRLSVSEFLRQWSGESLFLGKTGFGLPEEYPLAIRKEGPARPELEIARQAIFPGR